MIVLHVRRFQSKKSEDLSKFLRWVRPQIIKKNYMDPLSPYELVQSVELLAQATDLTVLQVRDIRPVEMTRALPATLLLSPGRL